MNEEEEEAIEYLSNLDAAFIVNGFKKKTRQAIQITLGYIEKLQGENEKLEMCIKAEEKYSQGLNEDIKSLLNIEPNTNFIHKDKIRKKIEELEEDLIENYGELGKDLTTNEIKTLEKLLKEE